MCFIIKKKNIVNSNVFYNKNNIVNFNTFHNKNKENEEMTYLVY